MRQLLEQSRPHKFILGVRETRRAQKAYDELSWDRDRHILIILPLELTDMNSVKVFSQQGLQHLGESRIDFLMLNAGMAKSAEEPGPRGSKWCEAYLVNHLCKCPRTIFWSHVSSKY